MDGGRQKQFKPPAGWTTCRLGELLPLSYGKALRKDRRNPQGDVPVYGSSGVVGSHDEALTSGEALIVGRKGNAGAVYFSDRPCWPIDTAYFAEPTTGLSSRFWYHYLTHLRLGELDQSTAIPSLNRDIYGALVAPVPPANEQLRIASKIDELFSQIDAGEANLRRVQALVKTYRQSVLKAAVTGDLTRDWRDKNRGKGETGETLLKRILAARRQAWEDAELAKLRAKGKAPKDDKWKAKYKEPAAPDTSGLPDLPEDWVWATIDQVSSMVTSGSRDWKRFYGKGKDVFILAQNIRPMNLDLSHVQLVGPPEGDRDALRSEVAQDDILVTIVGANTGDVCRVPGEIRRHYVCQSVALVRPVIRELSVIWELFLAAQEGGQRQFQKFIYGAGRPHLSFDQLKETCVPIPFWNEVGPIIEAVAKSSAEIGKIGEAISKASRQKEILRQSILTSAFAGSLVPQHPGDEPAAELFKRVAVER